MAREGMHIGHQHRLPLRGGSPANPFTDRNAHAGDLALKRPEHQFVIRPQEIEAGPVQIRHQIENEGGKIGGIGDKVALVMQKPAELASQLTIEFGLVAGLDCLRGKHLSPFKSRHPEPLLVTRQPA
ncbi:hypothetical protein D9M72_376270 [compost metagenome]